MQRTRQTHPLSSSPQAEPLGQLPEAPHEIVHMLPGKRAPSSQSLWSHSVAVMQGPPTSELSLPAVPDEPLPHAAESSAKQTKPSHFRFIAGGR